MDGFEWDEEKRRRNLEDHRVDFRLAAGIFRNTVIEAQDQRDRYDEPRSRPGSRRQRVLVVAYTWRSGNRRLISAWKVGPDGRRRYEAVLARETRAHGRPR
jgi:uncharacterized DUF497 family protein